MMKWYTSQIIAAYGIFRDETPKCTVYKVDWYTKYIRVRKGTKKWYSRGVS